MFCQKCNLHYPDHLSFCRRCGQPLARSTSDHAVDSHCCTRCGARVVRGENFCQQCGNRTGVALQDTVIGACYHCGTSWRSGWHFCKNCGLDRKRALLLSTSSPSSSASPTIALVAAKPSLLETVEDFAEAAKVSCQFCGAEAKPYSRFCESCGKRLDGTGVSKVLPSAAAIPLSAGFNSSEVKRASAPTVFEPPSFVESKTPVQSPQLSGVPSGELANSEFAAAKNPIGTSSGNLSNNISAYSENLPATDKQQAAASAANSERRPAPSETVVTPLPPFGRMPDQDRDPVTAKDIWSRNRRAILQSVALIVVAALLVAIVMWWISKARQKEADGAVFVQPTPTVSKPQAAGQINQATITAPDGMVYVPGGRFEMGRSNGDEYERPAHTVEVDPFFIDRTEVSNEQYQRFVTATNHRAPTHWQNGSLASVEAKLPVVNVSWDDATAYARWAGKRLPTEAEWEFAARGTDGRLYAWGNTWNPSASNAGHGSSGHIAEVGHFPSGASPFGAMDMCGNVWEWTSSSLQSYAEGHQEIAPGKVIRGGAFDVPSDRTTATYRGVLPADRLRDKTGFRTVRAVK